MGEGELEIITRGGAQLAVPAGPRAEESFLAARARLGSVRPRDARTRRLGEPRYRMDLLAELCDEETTVEVMHWLTNTRIGSDQSARDYADDLRHWAAVVREELGVFPMSFRDISPGQGGGVAGDGDAAQVAGTALGRAAPGRYPASPLPRLL